MIEAYAMMNAMAMKPMIPPRPSMIKGWIRLPRLLTMTATCSS